ncbi:MAG: hypothetical protein RG741_07235 [Bacteroidales bacterium]|nr:hypothetical protein [Bacteroidales bacterium]
MKGKELGHMTPEVAPLIHNSAVRNLQHLEASALKIGSGSLKRFSDVNGLSGI